MDAAGADAGLSPSRAAGSRTAAPLLAAGAGAEAAPALDAAAEGAEAAAGNAEGSAPVAADGAGWDRLRIDGGMSANNWMAQDLADVLNLQVERPTDVETTALGAAMCAAVGVGLYPSLAEASACMRPETDGFAPAMADAARDVRLAAWHLALTKVMA